MIVPSKRQARFWKPFAASFHTSKTIQAAVDHLQRGHVGLVVLINKYDGIDLPGDACRILALDGLPEAYGPLDRLEAMALEESEAMVTRQVQRIEQGMGRAVRSNEDHCVVVLLGARLTQRTNTAAAFAKFSPATRAQLKLSRDVAEMLHGQPFIMLRDVVEQCLQRDPGWVTASRNALDGVQYDTEDRVSAAAVAQREAFDLAELHRYQEAADRLQHVINAVTDRRLRGWLRQQAAGYLHLVDPVGAQRMLTSALKDNRALMKPRTSVGYHRLRSTVDQARQAATYLAERYHDGDELVLGVNAILDDLRPDPDPSAVKRFEQAMHDLGLHLGCAAQRPERDTGEGPDVLWLLGDLKFLVIECKSGASTDFIARHDAAQLSHSIDWFAERYGDSAIAIPVLVHKTSVLHKSATARAGTRVITFKRLGELCAAVRTFSQSVAKDRGFADPATVGQRLVSLDLNAQTFITTWGASARKARAV